jgi:hypothetical protein
MHQPFQAFIPFKYLQLAIPTLNYYLTQFQLVFHLKIIRQKVMNKEGSQGGEYGSLGRCTYPLL